MLHGAMSSHDLQMIQARRKLLADTIAQHEAAIAEAAAELAELDVAARVLARLADKSPEANAFAVRAAGDADGRRRSAGTEAESGGKPPGLPTVPDMITAALTAAHEQGSPGLTPSGMVSFVQGRWWKGATITDVGPTAWRMWKNGRLTKKDSIYSLPKGRS